MTTTDTRRRVKLYALNADRQWDDRGTGHVTSSYVDRVKGVSLLVHAENDGSMLLESKIHPDTIYHKQQDTLIVWSEGDNFDLALSFQEKAGCDEIWEKICQVQGKDPSVEITQDVVEESEDERFEDMSDSAPPIELPPCELSRLEDISEVISNGLTSPIRKDKLAQAIESENYIKKLLALFHVCEDLETQEGLHYLYDIFKNIFLLNKNALFEIMFAEDTIFDVVGCLEYDPSGNPPKNHRQYLKQLAKFREAIPIRNTDLLAKIHQTYRVQYIQDIVLPTPSVFEDNMLNTLSSFIFFNKVEIVTLIQEDEKFLDDLFTLLTDPQTTDLKRRDSILFLKEFCNFAQYLQPQGKETFYKTLISLGILPALEITLAINDKRTKSASIDILTTIVEYSPSIVRDYTLQQYSNSDTDEDQTLINIAIEQMLSDSEPELGGAVQLMGVLRILLDPENMLSSANKSEKSDFLNFFYKHSIQTLIAPLLLNTLTDKPANEDYHTVQLLGLVLELLSFCVEHHTYHIKNCIINKDLLRRILVLMKSTHTFLVLGALRFLRKIIALKDEFYNRHIVKGNLFSPVVDAFMRNNGRYNLLESAILELFEFIKLEDIKSLYTYFVENYSKVFENVQYVQTFKVLKTKYEQQQDRLKEKDKGNLDSVPSILRNANRYRRDQRQVDEEEEIWFNEEEDFSDSKSSSPELDATIGKMFEKKTETVTAAVNGPKYGSGIANSQSQLSQMQAAITATTTTGTPNTLNHSNENSASGTLDSDALTTASSSLGQLDSSATSSDDSSASELASSSSAIEEENHLLNNVNSTTGAGGNGLPMDSDALEDGSIYQALVDEATVLSPSSASMSSSLLESEKSPAVEDINSSTAVPSDNSDHIATALPTATMSCEVIDVVAAMVDSNSNSNSSISSNDSSSSSSGSSSNSAAAVESLLADDETTKRLGLDTDTAVDDAIGDISDAAIGVAADELATNCSNGDLLEDSLTITNNSNVNGPAIAADAQHSPVASSPPPSSSSTSSSTTTPATSAMSPGALECASVAPIVNAAPAVEPPANVRMDDEDSEAEKSSPSAAEAAVAAIETMLMAATGVSTATTTPTTPLTSTPTAATTPPASTASLVSGLKKGLVDYEGDSDEDEDDDSDTPPAQKKARIA